MKAPAPLRNCSINIKVLVGQAADSALDRLEQLAAAPVPVAPRIRLTCVFLQWDPKRAPAELDALSKRLRSSPELKPTIILVDNCAPEAPTARNDNATFVVGGDNSAWEFSGLQAGIDAARVKGIQTDVWLLANDRYRAANRPFLRYLTGTTARGAMQLGGIIGHIDAYPKAVSSYGYSIRRWVTTSFLLMSDEVLKRCLPLVSVDKDEVKLIIGDNDAITFRAGGSIGSDHAAYLRAWLTGASGTDLKTRWYAAASPGSLDSAVLRRKVQSILNEQLLSARALVLGIPLIRIQEAHRLAMLGLDQPLVQRERDRIVHQSNIEEVSPTARLRRLRLAFRLLFRAQRHRRNRA